MAARARPETHYENHDRPPAAAQGFAPRSWFLLASSASLWPAMYIVKIQWFGERFAETAIAKALNRPYVYHMCIYPWRHTGLLATIPLDFRES